MEGILRGKEVFGVEISHLMEEACSYDKKCFYFPIRHHSPACSYHLLKVINEYKPDCILIEGPENANAQLKDIMASETLAPFAIYYSYRDKKGLLDDSKGDYRCYYPFLDYSPELVAMRETARLGIDCEFIDLPYEEILIVEKEGTGLRKNDDSSSYNDDHYLSENSFIKRLVDKTEVRSFDEFWEKYFELQGLSLNTDEFIKNMLYYCVLSRASSDRETLAADGCLARESYMRDNISRLSLKYNRLLVMTGGFHTAGLISPEKWIMNGDGKVVDKNLSEVCEVFINETPKVKLHNIDEKDKGVYLMSYSMEATDRLNGYASGMPHPMFYQRIWDGLVMERTGGDNEDNKESEFPGNIYTQVILQYLVEVGKKVRKKEAYPSTYDEICAFNMCNNLAGLRNKCCPGVYELIDSVLSNYVKGEYNLATDRPMRILKKELTGKKIGQLSEDAVLPPLCKDFEKLCHSYRLDIHTSTKKELTLQIFSSKRHRDISSFLYQMVFLDTGFAVRKKGANLRFRKDRNLIREVWDYKFSPGVMSALVEASVYGGTLKEACGNLVEKKLFEEVNAAKVSELVISMFEMGIDFQSQKITDRMLSLIQEESDFFALTKTFSNITMLIDLSELYGSDMKLISVREILVTKLLSMLIHMTGVKEENVTEMLEALKKIYSVLLDKRYEEDRLYYIDVLKKMVQVPDIHPGLLGACQGVLYAYRKMDKGEIATAMKGYLSGSGERAVHAAEYIRGIFFMARDILFVDDCVLNMLDEFVGNTDYDTFIRLLPQFRLAFSYFTPAEIDRMAGRIAGKYNMTGEQLIKLREVTDEEYAYGQKLEKKVLGILGM